MIPKHPNCHKLKICHHVGNAFIQVGLKPSGLSCQPSSCCSSAQSFRRLKVFHVGAASIVFTNTQCSFSSSSSFTTLQLEAVVFFVTQGETKLLV